MGTGLLVGLVLFLGVLVDAFSGFTAIRGAQPIIGSIGMLMLLGSLYFIGEGIVTSVEEIDQVTQPLWRRVINLFLLLSIVGLLMLVFYYVFNFFKI